jgi:hypothetical protein
VFGYDAYNCSAFQSQSQAQSVLRYDPSDPNRLDAEDGNEDGVACRNTTYSTYPNDRDESAVQRTTATMTPTVIPTNTPGTPRAFTPTDYLGQGDKYNCIDFASQKDAQSVLKKGIELGQGDPNLLDTHSPRGEAFPPDGIACNTAWEAPEWASFFYYPEPHDMTPVARTPVPTPMPTRTPTPGAATTQTPTPTPKPSGSARSVFGP